MAAGLGERGGRPSGRGLLPQFRLPGGRAGEKVRPGGFRGGLVFEAHRLDGAKVRPSHVARRACGRFVVNCEEAVTLFTSTVR